LHHRVLVHAATFIALTVSAIEAVTSCRPGGEPF
jgi:hypothetical protein